MIVLYEDTNGPLYLFPNKEEDYLRFNSKSERKVETIKENDLLLNKFNNKSEKKNKLNLTPTIVKNIVKNS